jgi:hypothetical protein
METNIKTELQNLRTLRNLHVKYLKRIRYLINHRQTSGWDGYYSDKVFEEIIELLDEHDSKVKIDKAK